MESERDNRLNSLKRAMHCSDWPKQEEAIQAKYDCLIENETCDLTSTPENQQIIIGQWCFKLKNVRNGQILKYKARQVAHGIKLEEGIDFVKTFPEIVKLMLYKCLLGVSVNCSYKIRQMEVVTAFLYRFLDDII